MKVTPCLSGHLFIKKDGRSIHLSPDDLKDLHKLLHRNNIHTPDRDTVLDELQEIESQSLEDVQVELDKERLYRQFGRDEMIGELIEWVLLYRIEVSQYIVKPNSYHCNRFHNKLLELRTPAPEEL